MRSITRSLQAWIIGALALGSVLIALSNYLVTLDEMNEVFDFNLKSVAETAARYQHLVQGPQIHGAPVAPLPAPPAMPSADPDEYEIVTAAWTPDGLRLYSSHPGVELPFSSVVGLSRPRVGTVDWIVYTAVGSGVVAQAAQRVSARREMAGESAAKVLPPMLALIAVVVALLAWGLRRGLRPLNDAARDVAARSVSSLDPVPTSEVPREIAPLVVSINDLMSRLAASFAGQRRFLADAAHELRTPVTALRLQLQLLRRSGDAPAREEALHELELGVERSQRLIEQLLQVSRSEPDVEWSVPERVDLAELVRAVVTRLAIKAEQRGIDLGASVHENPPLLADANQLAVLLTNLVDNAIRYTPAGGRVDVEACSIDGHAALRVIDDGPGIAPEEQERVFDRFYRGRDVRAHESDASGSGLGLAIVRAIAARHGARVGLHTPAGGRGLEVRVEFSGFG